MKPGSEIISHYFPNLSSNQQAKFSMLGELYEHWNAQINVISRKDMDQFYLHHVLHSLAIAKVLNFKPGSEILDVGTGGGFPGIPLAILFPETKFHLVDSIGKKIKVVDEVANALGLENVKAEQRRVEELQGNYDFVVSRAVAQWTDLYLWTWKLLKKKQQNGMPNGWLLLKGGDLSEEFKQVKHGKEIYSLSDFFQEEFFETKKLVYVQA